VGGRLIEDEGRRINMWYYAVEMKWDEDEDRGMVWKDS
jgi:hypothetical protein